MFEHLGISALTGKRMKGDDDFAIKEHLLFCNHKPDFEDFSILFLTAPWPTLSHYRGDSLTQPMLITAFYILNWNVTRSLGRRLGP